MQSEEYAKMRAMEDRYWWFVARRKLALRLVRDFGPHHPLILDVGSGTGAVMAEMGALGRTVGVDFSDLALRFSAERGLSNLVHGDAQALPFASGTFDVVVSLDTVEHLPDDRSAVDEIYRVLKPGGVFVMNVPAFRWLWGPHDVALMHFRRYKFSEVRSLLLAAGFGIGWVSYSVFLFFPLVVVRRLLERLRKGEPRVTLPNVPGPLNAALEKIMEAEAAISRVVPMPWGSSVVAVARKAK